MRVLLATDGSEAAQEAGRWLTLFPLPAETELLVLTAASPASATSAEREAPWTEAREVAEAARRTIAERWPAAEARVEEGDPRPVVLQVAEQWRAELVVLGARGLGTFAGLVLGSVSVAVARHAPCPVLVTKGAPRPVRSALVAVDGSPDSLAAARFCASLPLDPSTRLRLVGVAERPHFPASAPGSIRPQLRAAARDMLRERSAHMEEALRLAERELGSRPANVERAVVVGNPGEAIVQAAQSVETDLVALGARGLGVFGRLVLGSVSEHVLRHAACPVLIVKR